MAYLWGQKSMLNLLKKNVAIANFEENVDINILNIYMQHLFI